MNISAVSVLDHIYLPVSDYDRSKAFFVRALAPLGIGLLMERERVAVFGREHKPELWIQSQDVTSLDPRDSTTAGARRVITPIHVALRARSRIEVDAFHRAALEAGGRDNGAPGFRPEYHHGYYGAFVIGPDGPNLEAVFHGVHRPSP